MNLSRRSLLKASALSGAATILGWRPALSAPSTPYLPVEIAGPPPSGSIVQLGNIVAVSEHPVPDDLREYVEGRCRTQLARYAEANGLSHPAGDEVWIELGPGQDHWDPLAFGGGIGLKQEWVVA